MASPAASSPPPSEAPAPAGSASAAAPPSALPPRPPSIDALVEAALAALASADAGRYRALLFRRADLQRHCPALLAEADEARMTRIATETAEAVRRCAELVDFSRAERLEVLPGERRHPLDECHGEITELGDVVVRYRFGGQRFEVTLDDPLRLPEGYALGHAPVCRAVGQPPAP